LGGGTCNSLLQLRVQHHSGAMAQSSVAYNTENAIELLLAMQASNKHRSIMTCHSGNP
jgi:hypothetical protein